MKLVKIEKILFFQNPHNMIKNKLKDRKLNKIDSKQSKDDECNELKNIQHNKINSLIHDCKADWEIVRLKKCERNKRDETIHRILERFKGNYSKILRKRTGSRIFQSIFKYSNTEMKEIIFTEIRSDIPDLINCSFSIFFLQKLLSTSYFHQIVEIVTKNYKKIIADRVGSFFVDEIYQKMKTYQKKEFLKSILGNKGAVFYSNKKLDEIPLKELNYEDITRKMLDKGLSNLMIAHDMIKLHISHFEDLEERKVYLRGLVEFFIDFLHTENGRIIADQIFDEEINHKKITKQVGEHLESIISSDYSQDFLIKIIQNCDEKYVKKYILQVIKGNIDTFCNVKLFDAFIMELIKIDQIDYLKEKLVKEINKKGMNYSVELREIAGKLSQ